ncbi:MAG: CRISPR-associated endonuclease Cas1 [Azospirillum sp.]|nr:CRISPR-associated endonuclease Cas1 [Azospirillum sp.]
MLSAWIEAARGRLRGAEPRQPLTVQATHGELAKEGACLRVRAEGLTDRLVRLDEVSEVVLMGRIAVTTPCLHELFERGVPVAWCSAGGWLYGVGQGLDPGAAGLRCAQYRASETLALAVARELAAAKIHNSRVLMRRHRTEGGAVDEALLGRLSRAEARVPEAGDLETLRGIEGAAAAAYFSAFRGLIKPRALADGFPGRRRPAADPVNGLLSLCYGILVRATTLAVLQAGFDPVYGFLHGPARGRPGLALDLMEPLRPVVGDATALRLINTGAITAADYAVGEDPPRFADGARRRIVEAMEARLAERPPGPWLAVPPSSYRHLLAAQAKALAGNLLDPERSRFAAYLWR